MSEPSLYELIAAAHVAKAEAIRVMERTSVSLIRIVDGRPVDVRNTEVDDALAAAEYASLCAMERFQRLMAELPETVLSGMYPADAIAYRAAYLRTLDTRRPR